MSLTESDKKDWLYIYKKKIILGILLVLTLAITATMVFIALLLRDRLIDDSKIKTNELSQIIKMNLSQLMVVRDPDQIQTILENLNSKESSVAKAFILNRNGMVMYSTDKKERGMVIDNMSDKSCIGCHISSVLSNKNTTIILDINGTRVLRNVNVIYNDTPCHTCHPASQRINGKLIIDRSLKPTYTLIATLELIIACSGIIVLIIIVPLLSRLLSKGLNKYINEIVLKSTELSLLYGVVERLSKTIEMADLKHTVVDIIKDVLQADEIDIILPKEYRDSGAIAWREADNKIYRRKIEHEDPLNLIVNKWLKGEISDDRISADKKLVYMPLSKGDNRLALIIVRKKTGEFDPFRLGLISIITSHLAVAFENAMLYHIAITDELTNLYSKRYFRYSIEKKFVLYDTYGEKLSLLMIDVDNFKKINDTYGHPVGDLVLKDISHCILVSVRDDDLAFRYGGEELSVLLPATDSSSAKVVAERIRETIANYAFNTGDQTISVTVSIGVASCPQNSTNIRDLIVEADKSLYDAKKTGKNKVVVSTKDSG